MHARTRGPRASFPSSLISGKLLSLEIFFIDVHGDSLLILNLSPILIFEPKQTDATDNLFKTLLSSNDFEYICNIL